MMRDQRLSPDCLPLNNGKKPTTENGRLIPNGLNTTSTTITTSTSFESKGFRFRSPSRAQDHHHHHHHRQLHNGSSSPPQSDNNHRNDASPSPSPSRGGSGGATGSGEMLLQWGQKKRTRVSRSEIRALADESSSSAQARQPISKLTRRADNKLSTPTMPPPPLPPPLPQQSSRSGNIRKESSAFLSHRNLEKRSGTGNGSPSRNSSGSNRIISRSTAGKRSPPTPDKTDRKITSSRPSKDEKPNGSMAQADHRNRTDPTPAHSEQEAAGVNNTTPITTAGEKLNAEVIEWPRIYIALSRKEKEDDFFAMKGTKLPQRPKKRAKNIDKTLQYCFPGMWLSDLTKSRYEVREKKCVKKQQKRRGLKGMESIDSESE